MKALLLKLVLATGFLVGAHAVEPVSTTPPLLRMPPAGASSPQRALPAERRTATRPRPLEDFQARALERTARDAQNKVRLLLAEFGEPEDAALADAMARHPGLEARMAEVFAGPEVRSFSQRPDGALEMRVKRI